MRTKNEDFGSIRWLAGWLAGWLTYRRKLLVVAWCFRSRQSNFRLVMLASSSVCAASNAPISIICMGSSRGRRASLVLVWRLLDAHRLRALRSAIAGYCLAIEISWAWPSRSTTALAWFGPAKLGMNFSPAEFYRIRQLNSTLTSNSNQSKSNSNSNSTDLNLNFNCN